MKFAFYSAIIFNLTVMNICYGSDAPAVYQRSTFDINTTKLSPHYMGVDYPRSLYDKLKAFSGGKNEHSNNISKMRDGNLGVNSLLALKSNICSEQPVSIRYDKKIKKALLHCQFYRYSDSSILLEEIERDMFWDYYELLDSRGIPITTLFKEITSGFTTQFEFALPFSSSEMDKVMYGEKVLSLLTIFTPSSPYTKESSHYIPYPLRSKDVTHVHSIIGNIKELWLYDDSTGKIYQKVKVRLPRK